MPARSGWICVIASVVAFAGCGLDRAGIAAGRDASAGPRDASADAAPGDGGTPLCSAGGCDDGNACTDDVCNPGIGCVHTPVSGSCDDGVLCNGADSCGTDGTCSVHDGVDPCPGSSYCDAATDSCAGCESATDCPGEMVGDWGACTFPAGDPCAESGTRSRVVRSYLCSASGTCEATERAESEACVRETDGMMCRETTVGTWSACTYAGVCGETATRTRVDTAYVCGGGTCQAQAITMTDTAGCARDTDGTSCGPPIVGAWSLCGGYGDTCDETGTQNRTVTQPVCASGACTGSVVTPESQACTRDTDGVVCGGPTMCTGWSACMPAMGVRACAASGTGVRTRVCSQPRCASGTCSDAGDVLDSQSCTTDPMACVGAVSECGSCGDCGPGGMGHRECKASVGTCNGGGNCVGSSTVTVYVACSCS